MPTNAVNILLAFETRTAAKKEAQRQITGLNKHITLMRHIAERVLQINVAQAFINGIPAAMKADIEFNRMLQDTTDSLRAMAIANSGTQTAETLQNANLQSAETLQTLRDRANSTGQTLQTLIGIFQQSAGVAQQNGISLQNWAKITAEATRAGTNLGLTTEQIRTSLTQIATGEAGARNLLARAIGIDTQTLRTATEAGTAVDLL